MGDQAIGLPFDYRCEGTRQVVDVPRVEYPHAEAKRIAHRFDVLQVRSRSRIVGL
jgi:hypothetical protein